MHRVSFASVGEVRGTRCSSNSTPVITRARHHPGLFMQREAIDEREAVADSASSDACARGQVCSASAGGADGGADGGVGVDLGGICRHIRHTRQHHGLGGSKQVGA